MHWWPANSWWDWHCANPQGVFTNLRYFNPPLAARYGNASSLLEYTVKSQVQVYESHRALFEAYSKNKYTSTGVIQWMLNNAWPEMLWHLYDFYLNPTASYFAAKKAGEPLIAVYDYKDHSVWVVESAYKEWTDVSLLLKIFSVDGSVVDSFTTHIPKVGADGSIYVTKVPKKEIFYKLGKSAKANMFFLSLLLQDGTGKQISNNFYWISSAEDTLVWGQSNFYRTPCSSYADFLDLDLMPKISIAVSHSSKVVGTVGTDSKVVTTVTVQNPNSNALAFFIRLQVLYKGQYVWPIFWEDNYISLPPTESSVVEATYLLPSSPSLQQVDVTWEFWNNNA